MRIVIAGGGTGGHLYPGIALAETFSKCQTRTQILFIGTTQGIGTSLISKSGFQLETVTASGFIGKGLSGKLKSLLSIPQGLGQSLGILKKFRPQLVISVGGYVAVPVMLAATLLRMKRVILEPNVMPGLVNKITAPLAHLVVTTFEASDRHLPHHKIKRLGIPVRPEIMHATPIKKNNTTLTLLILGGSQGAHSINRAMMDALPFLKKATQALSITHQTGKSDCKTVEAAYKKAGFQAEVTAFIDDMAGAYSRADLIISRAGAGTLAEIAVIGKASIMIPFPYAAGHQIANANAFSEIGAAEMILDQDLCGEGLAETILSLHADPVRLKKMGEAALQHGNPNAAEDIVKLCTTLVEKTHV